MPSKRLRNYADGFIGKILKIEIDRPIGSKHPKYGFIYEANYGFVPGTEAPDGEEIDAYLIGKKDPVENFTGKCVAMIRRMDDNDDKLVIIPLDIDNVSDEEINRATEFQEKFFNSKIIRK